MKTCKASFTMSSLTVTVCFLGLALSGCVGLPKPLAVSDPSVNNAKTDLETTFQDQEAVSGPISIEEAIARALKYNLHHRVKAMEEALAAHQLDAAQFELLPSLTAGAGYDWRDNTYASSSTSILTGRESLEPSNSQDKELTHADLSLTWNLLDFGVNYYQSRQQANRQFIAAENQRKAAQKLVRQVREAFWLVAGTQHLSAPLSEVLQDAEAALAKAEQMKTERLRPPLEMLRYQESLLEIVKRLKDVRGELRIARPKLASLMNLPPGQPFDVVVPEKLRIPEIAQSVQEMEEAALLHRPDLREAEYEIRISADETRKAITGLLPELELNLDSRYNSNSYLVNSNWVTGGARITWNLMNLLSAPSKIEAAKTREEIARSSRLVLCMAALAQVHIAKLQYDASLERFQWISTVRKIKEDINRQVMIAKQNRASGSLEEIRAAADLLIARLLEYKMFAGLHGAYGKVQETLGEDFPAGMDTSADLHTLTETIGSADPKTDGRK